MIYALAQSASDSWQMMGSGAFIALLSGAMGYGTVRGQLNRATRDIEALKVEREKDLADLRSEFRTSMSDMQTELRNGFNGQDRRLRELERAFDFLIGELRGQGKTRARPRGVDPDEGEHPEERRS